MNYSRAWKCHKCPESNSTDGCPAWWEYASENGNMVKGCSLAQEMGLNIVRALCASTMASAASADKAANEAAAARRSGDLSVAVLLGLATGEIQPQRKQLEAPDDDEEIRPRLGPVRRQ